ncbi:hypothetical protein [Streptomyces sp. NPDC001389]|uniref:RraA family protein n=1 Tax=unclassified Streptomyces TaxID=2593676 RepID=UPI0036896A83
MGVTPLPTADLCDEHGESPGICTTAFRPIGGRRLFAGPVRTVRCHEDNALPRELLHTSGEGAVLVVDGGGSLRTALVGDLIAGAAERSGSRRAGAGHLPPQERQDRRGLRRRARHHRRRHLPPGDDDGVVVLPAA